MYTRRPDITEETLQDIAALPHEWQTHSVSPKDLLETETHTVVQRALQSADYGLEVLKNFLFLENHQYRGGVRNFPSIMAKAKGVYAVDTASETDEHGKPIRTKETPDFLKKIVKFSEVYELFIELDKWFSSREKNIKEYLWLKSITDKFAFLVTNFAFENKEQEQEFLEACAQLEEYTEKKRNLEYKLASEIVDIHYNLVHLLFLDKKGEHVYKYWLNVINQCLGWSLAEALALTIAKYHIRICKSNGRNNSRENTQIAAIIATQNEASQEKITFPSDEQLKKFVLLLDQLRARKENPDEPLQISLPRRMEYFMNELGIEKMYQSLKHYGEKEVV